MKYGLTGHQFELITQCFAKFPELEKVILFGSRAMGNHKRASDVDLMLVGVNVSDQTLARLSGCLNEGISVPLGFDLVREPLTPELREHINRYGVVIFSRSSD